jgi:hypothetical protein
MTTDKRIDFGPLAVRTFDSECFRQMWEIVAPPGGSIHTDPGLQHVLDFRPDGAWLNPDWIAVEEFSLTSPVETDSGPRDLPRDEKQRAGDADSIRHRRPYDFTRWSAQLQVLKSAQKADKHPRMPFPFSACDLAAFMLHGPGAILADAFGGLWRIEPDLEPLGESDAVGTPKGQALCSAWKAIRLVELEFGRLPVDAQQLTAALPVGAPNLPQPVLDAAEADYKGRFADWLSGAAKCLVEASGPQELSGTSAKGGSAVGAASIETPTERRFRRLARFRALGGDIEIKGAGVTQLSGRRGAQAELAREEQDSGHPMSKRQDVSKDLRAAIAEEMQR